jgi:hypothetical protein
MGSSHVFTFLSSVLVLLSVVGTGTHNMILLHSRRRLLEVTCSRVSYLDHCFLSSSLLPLDLIEHLLITKLLEILVLADLDRTKIDKSGHTLGTALIKLLNRSSAFIVQTRKKDVLALIFQ